VDPDADVPPSRQLVEQILDAIASGRLPPGAQLPSVRGMAAEAMVNHNTVARAYQDLERLGITVGVNGRGVFVTPGAARVASAQRRSKTLAAAKRAIVEALRAGNGHEDLQDFLREEARKSA
jgi:GntR family transcriptional regulator